MASEKDSTRTAQRESYHERRKGQALKRPMKPICDAGGRGECAGSLHNARMVMNFLGKREEVSGRVCDYHIDRVHNRKRSLENMGVDTVVFIDAE